MKLVVLLIVSNLLVAAAFVAVSDEGADEPHRSATR